MKDDSRYGGYFDPRPVCKCGHYKKNHFLDYCMCYGCYCSEYKFDINEVYFEER